MRFVVPPDLARGSSERPVAARRAVRCRSGDRALGGRVAARSSATMILRVNLPAARVPVSGCWRRAMPLPEAEAGEPVLWFDVRC